MINLWEIKFNSVRFKCTSTNYNKKKGGKTERAKGKNERERRLLTRFLGWEKLRKKSQFAGPPGDLKWACTNPDFFWPACCLADFLHIASKIASDMKKLMSYVEKRITVFSGLKLTNLNEYVSMNQQECVKQSKNTKISNLNSWNLEIFRLHKNADVLVALRVNEALGFAFRLHILWPAFLKH